MHLMSRRVVLPLLIAMAAAGISSAVEWYQSSPGGISGSPLTGGGPEAVGWSLSVDNGTDYSDGRETRLLYLDGELFSSTVYYRSNGRMTARENLDSSGEVLSRVEYAYDREGIPRAMYITTSDESLSELYVETDTAVNSEGTFHRHTGGSSGDWYITDLNQYGQPVARKVLDSGVITVESSWARNDKGILGEEIHRSGNEERRIRYDANGRLLEETTIRNDLVVLVRSYFWTNINLTRVEERGEGHLLVREMEWSGDRIIYETRSENGVITSQTEWTNPDERVETLFRDGKAVIRVYWSGDTRQREEFLKDGEVIRTREGNV